PNTTGGTSVSIINTTTSLVQLTLTGPTTTTVNLAPSGIVVVVIQPGNYTFTGALPNSPNTSLVPSSWSVVGGCDYLLTLVATSQTQMKIVH
ncbi:MAG TPA: hypothetical protein VLV86_18405, partial [Vicinamibacterales bacterium]|nr:hypothetical protein [Vicinamibacterales bacterium]